MELLFLIRKTTTLNEHVNYNCELVLYNLNFMYQNFVLKIQMITFALLIVPANNTNMEYYFKLYIYTLFFIQITSSQK